jgi:hypothetical protein
MKQSPKQRQADPETAGLTREERKSLTHGEFWIPEAERAVYKRAIETLNRAGVPFVISGLYAIYEYTGIYRDTKDLDLFFEPRHVLDAARALRAEGFRTHLEEAHWLAKAFVDGRQVDLIFGMGNGMALIDGDWYRHSRRAILAGTPVRVAPPEDLIWHRLFVAERHRSDVADIMHLFLCRGHELDWDRLTARVHEHWRLLLAQIHLFDYVYPGHRDRIPRRVRETLFARAHDDIDAAGTPRVCHGTLLSRFSYSIDVHEWGFRNLRKEAVIASRELPIVQEIARSDVGDTQEQGEAFSRSARGSG